MLFAVKDIDGFDVIQKALDNLKDETEKWLKSNFEQWRDQAMASISQGDLTYVSILSFFLQLNSKRKRKRKQSSILYPFFGTPNKKD